MDESALTGDDVRRERKSLGLTQAELGEIIGYSERHISIIECGKSPVPKHFALALAWIISNGPEFPWTPYGLKPGGTQRQKY